MVRHMVMESVNHQQITAGQVRNVYQKQYELQPQDGVWHVGSTEGVAWTWGSTQKVEV